MTWLFPEKPRVTYTFGKTLKRVRTNVFLKFFSPRYALHLEVLDTHVVRRSGKLTWTSCGCHTQHHHRPASPRQPSMHRCQRRYGLPLGKFPGDLTTAISPCWIGRFACDSLNVTTMPIAPGLGGFLCFFTATSMAPRRGACAAACRCNGFLACTQKL